MDKPLNYDNLELPELPDRDAQKNYLKKKLPDYVKMITQKDPVYRQYYLCPFSECKDREHTHSTGGAFSIKADKTSWKCFSCGRSGDIFDLIGYLYNIKSGSKDTAVKAQEFKKEFDKACELFELQPDFIPDTSTPSSDNSAPVKAASDQSLNSSPAETPTEAQAPASGKTYKEYLTKCHDACIPGSAGYEYLIKRGFTAETIERCSLGYDSDNNTITIPYSNTFTYFIGRSLEGHNFFKAPGFEPIFNQAALYYDQKHCFICESQLDAISIIQAGGSAIALGGVGVNKLKELLADKQPSRTLILFLDRDKPGRKGQDDLVKALEEIRIPFIEAEFSWDQYGEPQKDANDLLISNPSQFEKDVQKNIKAAHEYDLENGYGLYSVGDYKDLFRKHQTTDKQRMSTGFRSLDVALYGGFCNELYILSADTSLGKSAIACALAQNVSQNGIDVLYYALEMSRDEFIARGASMISREEDKNPIPYAEILNYKYDKDMHEFYKRKYTEYEHYVDVYMERYGSHLYFIEGGFYGRTALSIANTAEQFKKDHNIKQLLIVVDYLQRLKADPNDRSQRDVMSITSGAVQVLGNLATQKHNTVLALSSISNAQMGKTVTTTAGKYSGDIGYTGGILLGWNWEGYSDTTKTEDREATAKSCKERGYRDMILEVLKQRSGERDHKVRMLYYPAYNYFESPEDSQYLSIAPSNKKKEKKARGQK